MKVVIQSNARIWLAWRVQHWFCPDRMVAEVERVLAGASRGNR